MADLAIGVAGFVLTLMLHASVLLGAVWLAERARWLRHPRWAEVAWRGALFGALASATVATVPLRAPDLQWPIDSGAQGAALTFPAAKAAASPLSIERIEAVEAHAPRAARGLRVARVGRGVDVVAPAVPAISPLALPRALVWGLSQAWLALTVAWIGVTLLRAHRVRSLLRRAWRAPVAGRRQQAQAAELAQALHVAPLRLHVDAALASPVALPSRTVVLPRWSTRLPDAESRALLAHEIAHLARRDPAWRIAQHFALAPLCLHPLAWHALRRLDALAELQSDATAARLLGDGRPLAECLVRCLAQHASTPLAAPRFALAMAERPGAVVDRVQRLLEEDPMEFNTPSPRRTRLAIGFGLLAALTLPTIAVTALADVSSGMSISINSDDDGNERMHIRSSHSGYALEVEMDGKIEFAPDESDVLSMQTGAELSIEETRDGVTRAIEFSPTVSGIQRVYSVDGDARPFDADGRAWLAQALPEIFRSSGIDAEGRAKRILARGGSDALLAEIDQIRGDHGRVRYLGLAYTLAKLDAVQLTRALELTRAIESDYELRQALSAALQSQTLDPTQQMQVLDLSQELESDYERAELLVETAARFTVDDAALQHWSRALQGIESDYEQRRVLEALLARTHDNVGAVRLAFDAARTIDSDYEKRQLLEAGLARAATDPTVRRDYVAVAAGLGSDYELKEALTALLRGGPVDAALAIAVLDAIDGIGSDYETKEALLALARVMPADAAVVERYRATARKLGAYERGEAEQALDRLLVSR